MFWKESNKNVTSKHLPLILISFIFIYIQWVFIRTNFLSFFFFYYSLEIRFLPIECNKFNFSLWIHNILNFTVIQVNSTNSNRFMLRKNLLNKRMNRGKKMHWIYPFKCIFLMMYFNTHDLKYFCYLYLLLF